MKITIGTGLLSLLLFEFPFITFSQTPLFNASGRVYETNTRSPLAGAIIQLSGSDGTHYEIITRKDGKYYFDSLKVNENFKITCNFTGWPIQTREFSTVINVDESLSFVCDFDFESATFPGGKSKLFQFVKDSIFSKTYRVSLGDTMLQKVICKFQISETGEVLNPYIIKSSNSKNIDELILSGIKKMPRWKPAMSNGKAVMQEMTLPIIIETK